jgi:4-hydroxybenzoate polyprenyltransferase
MLLTAFALSKFSKNVIFIVIFFFVALYSVGVNTLGALTSSANPPKVEILSLEKQTGKVQKFTYVRNIEFLKQRGSKSFVYNTFLEKRITPIGFYWWLVYIISAIIGLLIVKLSFTKNNDKS